MRRMICCGLFALLLSSGAVVAQTHFVPRPHPHPRVIVVHRHHFHPTCFLPTITPVSFLYPVPAFSGYSVASNVIPSSPEYVFVGSDSPARPQLVFKDGTSYFVSDYWRVDDQLHFVTVEDGGTKSAPHSVPFDSLDVERTKKAATAQGFRFLIRNEPIQQWLNHHAQHRQSAAGTTGKH